MQKNGCGSIPTAAVFLFKEYMGKSLYREWMLL